MKFKEFSSEEQSEAAENLPLKCLNCGEVSPRKEWQRLPTQFKCPVCSYKAAVKLRPPRVKRLSTR